MPLPFLLVPALIKGAAIIAGTVGAGVAIKGAVDAKNANDTMKTAENRNNENLEKFKECSEDTTYHMEELGSLQVEVGEDFGRFSNAFEKIKNRPEFSSDECSTKCPEFDFDQIKAASVLAGTLLGATSGGAAGIALGMAAATGLNAAVMALGTASTGTAIAGLSGAAATKATLAALGGGSLAVGGGGIAAGTAVLGAATLGVGLLIGGTVFAFTGSRSGLLVFFPLSLYSISIISATLLFIKAKFSL